MDARTVCAEGHANADFVGAAANDVGHEAVDADAGEKDGEQSEKRGELGEKPLVDDGESDFFIERVDVGDGNVAIDGVNGLLGGGGDGGAVSGVADGQLGHGVGSLHVGEVVHGHVGRIKAAELRVLDDTDYFNIVGVQFAVDSEVASDGRAGGKHGAGHGFADDGDFGRVRGVLRTEDAAGDDGNLQDGKVVCADDVVEHADVFVVVVAGDVDGAAPCALVEGVGCVTGGCDAGELGDAALDLLMHGGKTEIVVFVSGGAVVELEKKHVVAVEAGVDMIEIDEAAQEEAGADKQNERQRNLGDYERAGQGTPGRAARCAAAVFQRRGELKARGAECGNGAEENRGEERDGEREQKQPGVDGDIEGECFRAGDHVQQHAVGQGGEGDAECASGEREGEAFCQELTDDAQAACAERLADGKFAGARGGAGQQQVGDVGAGDEKHESDYGHEDFQRLRELSANGRKAVGHGRERDMDFLQLLAIFLRFGSVGIAAQELVKDLLIGEIDVGRGLIHADAGLHSTHDVEGLVEVVGIAAPVRRDGLAHGEGNPDVG